VQEVKDDFRHFVAVVERMGAGFDYVMTDTAGNDERLAFVYRKSRVKCGNLFAELALHPREYPKRTVKVRWEKDGQPQVQVFEQMVFEPFDRTPYIGSFTSGKIDFTLANVHLYFGKFEESKTEKSGGSLRAGCWKSTRSAAGPTATSSRGCPTTATSSCWAT
jgi:hypothetical protein